MLHTHLSYIYIHIYIYISDPMLHGWQWECSKGRSGFRCQKHAASDGKDSMLFICFTTCNEVCFRDSRVRMWVYMKTLYLISTLFICINIYIYIENLFSYIFISCIYVIYIYVYILYIVYIYRFFNPYAICVARRTQQRNHMMPMPKERHQLERTGWLSCVASLSWRTIWRSTYLECILIHIDIYISKHMYIDIFFWYIYI